MINSLAFWLDDFQIIYDWLAYFSPLVTLGAFGLAVIIYLRQEKQIANLKKWHTDQNLSANYFRLGMIAKKSKNKEECFGLYASHGGVEAQCTLGVMYEKGEGVEQDAEKACEWFEKAAQQGFAQAQYNLGAMYFEGKGVPQDFTKARFWLEKAAKQGHDGAQQALALLKKEHQVF